MTILPGRYAVAPGVGREMATVNTIPRLRRTIVAFQRGGYTMRTAMAAYRGAGGRIRTEDFATLWRDELRKRNGSAA